MILTELKVKTAFWKCLPWKLAGLAFPDLDRARQCAQECRKLWLDSRSQQSGARAVGAHHPMTLRFFDQEPCLSGFLCRECVDHGPLRFLS